MRKQFALQTREPNDWKAELRNITILGTAKHPQIVPLITAYIHRDKHNLVFPLAIDRALEDIFRGWVRLNHDGNETSAARFSRNNEDSDSGAKFVAELAGLTPALSAMHKLDSVGMMECHRDIKLENILVDGSQLFLTSFGISRVVSQMDVSETTAPHARGDYLSPDYKDLITRQRGRVGRSNDVWSLGRVLLNIFLMREYGFEAVNDFRNERRRYHDGFESWRFFEQDLNGTTVQNAVTKRLSLFASMSGREVYPVSLSKIIEDMLAIPRENRPKATAVTSILQEFVPLLRIEQVGVALKRILSSNEKTGHIYWESSRFRCWSRSLGLSQANTSLTEGTWQGLPLQEFEFLEDHLTSIVPLLASEKSRADEKRIQIQPIRHRIGALLGKLGPK